MKLSVRKNVHLVEPGDFEANDHWYPRVLNSHIHPLVSYFLCLGHKHMAERYCRLCPRAKVDVVLSILAYQPKYFRWAGTDLMHVTNQDSIRKMAVIETNSCPSGQKSMPLLDLNDERGGYKTLIEGTYKPMVANSSEKGSLAVIFDKNPMENFGYAKTIADIFKESVLLAEFHQNDTEPPVKFVDGKMFIADGKNSWTEIRAAFRYVTQSPWSRLPRQSKTLLLNPIEACLAGGRNKEAASVAYDRFNDSFSNVGLAIFTPRTFRNVPYSELQYYFNSFGGNMVIKVPNSNAGQGVFTVINQHEFEQTLERISKDELYLVQHLIHSNCIDSPGQKNTWYHVGTLPDSRNRVFAFDLRMMIHATETGFRPLAVYSRKTRSPLNSPLPSDMPSWEVYGTNLSVKNDGVWSYADERLMPFDIRNFGQLGLGVDELISGFIQSCMAAFAIDQHAIALFGS